VGGWVYGGLLRSTSFALASGLSALILLLPQSIARAPGDVSHGLLALLMWGIAGGFVHGVGYVPVHRLWRISLGPLVAIPIMVIGGILLLSQA
jgi:predicted membrane protein